MGAIYTDRIPYSKRIGGQINLAASVGVITDGVVGTGPYDTITEVKAAVTALATTPQLKKIASDTNLALDAGIDLGLWSESHGVNTVAELVALTDASTTHRQGLFS